MPRYLLSVFARTEPTEFGHRSASTDRTEQQEASPPDDAGPGRCPNCHADISDAEVYCPSCGRMI
jgi:hypothetical protein